MGPPPNVLDVLVQLMENQGEEMEVIRLRLALPEEHRTGGAIKTKLADFDQH